MRTLVIFLMALGLVQIPLAQANVLEEEAAIRPLSLELDLEGSWIRYDEADLDVTDEGWMWGVGANLAWRNPHKFVVKLDGHIAIGEVDYESPSGSADGINDFMAEPRVMLGYDIYFSDSGRFTPYVGFGYRYLLDEFSEAGPTAYDREANYYYVPIGFDVETALNTDWMIKFNLEYDLFIEGTQKTHLEDISVGVFANANMLENTQEDGYGVRGSIRFSRITGRVNIFLEPFVRYWNIEDSEVDVITSSSGVPIGFGFEPQNTSTEAGVKLGMKF